MNSLPTTGNACRPAANQCIVASVMTKSEAGLMSRVTRILVMLGIITSACQTQVVAPTTVDLDALNKEIDLEVERACAIIKSGDESTISNIQGIFNYKHQWAVVASNPEIQDAIKTCASIDYLIEIALGNEFGDSEARVHKWKTDVVFRVMGTPTNSDSAVLNAVLAELDGLIGTITISRDDDAANGVPVHFVPVSEMSQILPQYETGNSGFFWHWWDGSGHLYDGVVLIGSDVFEPKRHHIIREEITQLLGLAMDSFRNPTSIFQQSDTDVNRFAPLDEAVISLLYDSRVQSNATAAEMKAALGWSFSSN